MGKMVSFLMTVMVVVVVALFPHADASIQCYVCEGYSSDLPDHQLYNNKYCPQDNFDSSKVNKAQGTVCTAVYVEYDGEKATARSYAYGRKMDMNMTTRDANMETFRGYICDTNLCNDENPSASTTLTLHLPLLLLSLLAVLSRGLA